MDSPSVDYSTKEKNAREALGALARIIIHMYLLEHPLPIFEGTIPLYSGERKAPAPKS